VSTLGLTAAPRPRLSSSQITGMHCRRVRASDKRNRVVNCVDENATGQWRSPRICNLHRTGGGEGRRRGLDNARVEIEFRRKRRELIVRRPDAPSSPPSLSSADATPRCGNTPCGRPNLSFFLLLHPGTVRIVPPVSRSLTITKYI